MTRVTPLEPARPGKNRRKTWVAVAGLAASVFAIGLLASFGVETAAGHPLSGGSSGTSVGALFGQDTGTADATTTSSDEDTGSESATSETGAPGAEDTTRSTSTTRSTTTTTPRQLVPNQLLPGGGGSTNG